jgi:four helix bundle protein
MIATRTAIMSAYKSFEEMEVWRSARELSKAIYELTQHGSFAHDFGLRDQINKATGSIMDNIAEAFDRDGVREFIQFLCISKGSIGEVRSQLYRAVDRKHISPEIFGQLHTSALSVSNQLGGLISYLKRSGYRGKKF